MFDHIVSVNHLLNLKQQIHGKVVLLYWQDILKSKLPV